MTQPIDATEAAKLVADLQTIDPERMAAALGRIIGREFVLVVVTPDENRIVPSPSFRHAATLWSFVVKMAVDLGGMLGLRLDWMQEKKGPGILVPGRGEPFR